MQTVLIIEDEIDLQQVLEYNLRQEGYEVLCAFLGQEGLRLAIERSPQMVLLDLMLPDMPGTQVCRMLKADPRTMAISVIMMTARAEEADRIIGYELGAEDYVVKPFSIRELMLRIAGSLRRGQPAPESESVIEFGCLRIDGNACRVFVRDHEVPLTALEFKLLRKLYETKNRLQTRAMLVGHVWDGEADITTRTVDMHIQRLRDKLGAAGGYIETVREVGYRFASRPEEPGA